MTVKLGTFETRLATPAREGGIDLRVAAASDSGAFEGFLCRFVDDEILLLDERDAS